MRRRETRAVGRWIVHFILTVALVALAGGRAWAHEEGSGDEGSGHGGSGHEGVCKPACEEVRGACKDAARTDFKSCAKQCPASLFPENCYRVCREEFYGSRGGCKTDCRDCKHTCKPDGGDHSECERACMVDLSGCASGLRSAARECAGSCADEARAAFDECFAGDDPLPCLVRATHQLGECLGECAGLLREGYGACKEASEICRENCQTGSASKAFLDPTESLLD